MKTLITDGFDEKPRPVWPWTINAAAPLSITYSFPDVTGAMTVLPLATISFASGAAAVTNVVWR